jgi:flagellar hook-associated protein 1
MADILNIGLSALFAQQRALTTTSNNIANANTAGYSRQRVELDALPTETRGGQTFGTGVQVTSVRRLTDEILADQLRTSSAGLHSAGMFVDLAQSLDDLLAGSDTGLTATVQSFVNALQDLANDPASPAGRQALLSQAQSLTARFAALDGRTTEIGNEIKSRMSAAVDEINSLGAGLADINRKVLQAGLSTPHELLDQRDRMLERLSELVSVNTAVQSDGTLSVFIGSGQTLVLGVDSARLAIAPGSTDPEQPQIMLTSNGSNIDVTRFIAGGELGGIIDFNREMLAPTRSEIGRIAVALVETVNAAHRDGMDAEGDLGGDFFSIAGPRTFAAATNGGTGGVAASIADVAALQPTSYDLSFDGTNYTLLRADNGAVVPVTGAGTAANPFLADGLSIVVSGAPVAGDRFVLKPFEYAAGTMSLLVSRASDIAAAAPTRTRAALANVGTGIVSAGQVVDATDPGLLSTTTIQFLTPTTYSVNGSGSFAYTPGASIDLSGTRIEINGAPVAGDIFSIESNAGGVGDNRNAQSMIARLGGGVFTGNVSLQGVSATLVTNVGSATARMTSQRDTAQVVYDQSRDRLESVRGVNLDEEAANMLRYEQLYQAAAQTIAVAGNLFNTLLAALGR